jgi:hypothetical protein
MVEMPAEAISDQKRLVRAEHWLRARRFLRVRDGVHHAAAISKSQATRTSRRGRSFPARAANTGAATMTRWSRLHSADQDGFRDTKEDLADDIRARVRKRYPSETMKTLERMSREDLSALRFTLMDAEEKGR